MKSVITRLGAIQKEMEIFSDYKDIEKESELSNDFTSTEKEAYRQIMSYNPVLIAQSAMLNSASQLSRKKRGSCAVIIGSKCIPPCQKFSGKAHRHCSPMEKRAHIMYYLLR